MFPSGGDETDFPVIHAEISERLVREVIAYLQARGPCDVTEFELVHEDVHFRLPAAIA